MRVLIVDDDPGHGPGIAEFLKRNSIACDLVCLHRPDDAAREVCNLLWSVKAESEVYDFLLLDMHYRENFIGGAQIYLRILREDLRGKFRHIIIPTMHFSGNITDSPGYLATMIFAQMAWVPTANVLAKSVSKYPEILERMRALEHEQIILSGAMTAWKFH